MTSEALALKVDEQLSLIQNLGRLSSKSYVPTDADVLQSRLRTSGITETVFELHQFNYHVFDVEGERSGRKKWVHVFEEIDNLVFVVPLSGYDQCLIEDKTAVCILIISRTFLAATDGAYQIQMQEALSLFRSILGLSWFKRIQITLLFTKLDLFKEKIKRKALSDLFPEYTGPNGDASAALAFITHKFLSLNQDANRKLEARYVDTRDTERVRVFLEDLERRILEDKRHVWGI